MRRNILLVIAAFVIYGAGFASGFFALLFSTGGITEPSRDTAEAVPTLSLDEATPEVELPLIATEIAALNTKVDALSEQVASGAMVAESTETPTEDAVELPQETRALYRITEDGTNAIFRIEETIAGQPNLVEAVTRRVAGDIIINFTNPQASQLGQLAINARTFRTDDEFRDQSIRGQILDSDNHEFITFAPTELVGLPETPVGIGQSVNFQVVGDMTVSGITNSVTFDVTVNIDGDEKISGTATANINYTDFGLTINPPPGIADIQEDVELELDFVAELIEAR